MTLHEICVKTVRYMDVLLVKNLDKTKKILQNQTSMICHKLRILSHAISTLSLRKVSDSEDRIVLAAC